MDLLLHDRCVLITGAGGDIGQGIARTFLREGAIVILHGLDKAQIDPVAETLRATARGRVFTVGGDLAWDESARRVANEACACVGRVEILVNNAATFTHGSWFDDSPSDMLHLYDVNVVGVARLIQCLVPQMRERHWGGSSSLPAATRPSRWPLCRRMPRPKPRWST